MHDPAQNPPIVFSLRPGLVSWQMRLDLRPLRVAEPKQASFIGWPRWLTNPLSQHMVN
jgi:hypothetical protein